MGPIASHRTVDRSTVHRAAMVHSARAASLFSETKDRQRDRVALDTDPNTVISALTAGETDYLQNRPWIYPVLKADKASTLSRWTPAAA